VPAANFGRLPQAGKEVSHRLCGTASVLFNKRYHRASNNGCIGEFADLRKLLSVRDPKSNRDR
jgi:hypothetical protein